MEVANNALLNVRAKPEEKEEAGNSKHQNVTFIFNNHFPYKLVLLYLTYIKIVFFLIVLLFQLKIKWINLILHQPKV